MAAPAPPDVRPISLARLAAIALGTFLVAFILLELIDPLWIAAFRPPTPTVAPVASATAVASPRAVAAVPTPRARRRSGTPQPGDASGGEPAAGEPGDTSELSEPRALMVESGGAGARLRAAPDGTAEILATLVDGTIVEGTGQEAETEGRRWLEARVGDQVGWIAADLLLPAEAGR